MRLFVLTMFALLLAGCSDVNCPDCGPCGIAGPANQDYLFSSAKITEHDDVLRVNVGAGYEGSCDTDTVWIIRDHGVISFASKNVNRRARGPQSVDDAWVFADDNLRIDVDLSEDRRELTLTFSHAGTQEAVVECVHSGTGPDCGFVQTSGS